MLFIPKSHLSRLLSISAHVLCENVHDARVELLHENLQRLVAVVAVRASGSW